jgi:hypothetical protein
MYRKASVGRLTEFPVINSEQINDTAKGNFRLKRENVWVECTLEINGKFYY